MVKEKRDVRRLGIHVKAAKPAFHQAGFVFFVNVSL